MSGADRDTREAFVAPSYDRSAFEAYSARESTRRMGDVLDAALVRVEAQRMAHDA
jgi:hypothetical protein